MTTKSAPAKSRGAKKLVDDDELRSKLRRYGSAMLTEEECAAGLGQDVERLKTFLNKTAQARECYEAARMDSLVSLREAQFKHAQTNASMAMFLERTYLAQTEQRQGEDGETFDLSGAGRRLRDKVAAVAAAPAAPGDRESD
ncbi:MAG: hypothetical protein P4L64_11020 [Caulobacteraceae bacterium]|nr:hypothetical protein [Caulobacteraceae bacterium]